MAQASYLEAAPDDILRRIAILSASSSLQQSLHDILQLLLTSRRMYNSLSIHASPEVFANIFCVTFDISAVMRWFSPLSNSCIAWQLVHRCQVLRRIRHRDISPGHIRTDLWEAYFMVLENDGLNSLHLAAVGIVPYLLEIIRTFLYGNDLWAATSITRRHEVKAITLWLLWLTASRNVLLNESSEVRNGIASLIRPYAISAFSRASEDIPFKAVTDENESIDMTSGEEAYYRGGALGLGVEHFSRRLNVSCPSLSAVSILLTFVLKEAVPFPMPPHLPSSRAIADAMQRSGPTMEDIAAFNRWATPLFADTISAPLSNGRYLSLHRSRSTMHEYDFHRMIQPAGVTEGLRSSWMSQYRPGVLTGLWQGSYMVSPNNPDGPRSWSASPPPDVVARRPMQCHLSEHLCFSPNIPLPSTYGYGHDDDPHLAWSIPPCQLHTHEDGFQVPHEPSYVFRYETYRSSTATESRRIPSEVLDVVLTGETQIEHDLAWGGYRFSGRVRARDGLITLIREPKHGDDGKWVLEGFLYSKLVFVGRWRSGGMEGIFCLAKDSNDQRS